MPALVIGARRAVCAFRLHDAEAKFGYDDSLDAFGVHGVGGTLGAILTGVFATRACWNIDDGAARPDRRQQPDLGRPDRRRRW
jgi:ammonium transporter, Amt family